MPNAPTVVEALVVSGLVTVTSNVVILASDETFTLNVTVVAFTLTMLVGPVTAAVAEKVNESVPAVAAAFAESVTEVPLTLNTLVPAGMLAPVVVSTTLMPGKMPVAEVTVTTGLPLVNDEIVAGSV
jgi:hypothetical protein